MDWESGLRLRAPDCGAPLEAPAGGCVALLGPSLPAVLIGSGLLVQG